MSTLSQVHGPDTPTCPESRIEGWVRVRGCVCCKRIGSSYLPASDTEKEAEDIRLLLLLKLLDVLEGTHLQGECQLGSQTESKWKRRVGHALSSHQGQQEKPSSLSRSIS